MARRGRVRGMIMTVIVIGAVASFSGAASWTFTAFSRAVLAVAAPLYAVGDNLHAFFTRPSGTQADQSRIIRELQAQNANLKTLAAENLSLKEILSYRERVTDPGIVAQVVAASDGETTRALILDRGSDDGVRLGQPVTVGEGIIIGKIGGVRRESSQVILLSDSRSSLAVTTQSLKETLGVLEGGQGLSTTLSMIPPDQRLAPGDSIITSGLEPGIRRGYVVGVIERIIKNAQDPFQSASVQPFYASQQMLYVTIHGTE